MTNTIQCIVENNALHIKWLNTLSFMENAGARKISACEHPTQVGIIQLKHAAEEHRHAYYLKKQILKIDANSCSTYSDAELLAPRATRFYLHALDIQCSRYLKKQFQLQGAELKYAAYLFVTYAIEVRADLLYPVYQDILSNVKHHVMVKSIIVEEEGHLEEMIGQLNNFRSDWKEHASAILAFEQVLFEDWLHRINTEIHHASN
ncbi:hypothetical protein [Dyadobacter sp. LHD-138]|uniref:hypothetical protein n=1 Tax=Dyadobacter sp. LHD-138 TaxID=3071413 RepID=UPI0027E0CDE5|nr:hypothetical protein [Dyadobacter sp. LHD-138]MDQ6479450.1 hypothetical protein [Dyadobacter sp. LHD-138]